MTSLERAYRRSLANLGVDVAHFGYHKGHFQFTVAYKGRQRKLTGSGSPSDPDHAIQQVCNVVKRFMREVDQ